MIIRLIKDGNRNLEGKILNIKFVFSIVLCVLLGIILMHYIPYFYKTRKCIIETKGIIINIRKSDSYCWKRKRTNFIPIYRYIVNTCVYEESSPFVVGELCEYKVGQEISLCYEEDNPRNFVPSEERKFMIKDVIIAIGMFACCLGIIAWIL